MASSQVYMNETIAQIAAVAETVAVCAILAERMEMEMSLPAAKVFIQA